MEINSIAKGLKPESELKSQARPYFNHSVEFKRKFSATERAAKLEEVGLNVFSYPSEMVTGSDFLSDSGTTTMTNEQWAALHQGDEAYGSNRGYFLLMEQIRQTFGGDFASKNPNMPNAFLFHQGRPGEDALFTAIGRLGDGLIIPSNGHFDTTHANILANRMHPKNLFSHELNDPNSKSFFKGNIDLNGLEKLLHESADKIPVVYLTITNNTGGGQPVSMVNIKETAKICGKLNVPLFLDACRFAENAWFIKKCEPNYIGSTIPDIVREMFSYVDGFTISFKKDGLANMGGGVFLKENGLFIKQHPGIGNALMDHQILKEGHPSYGGMSGHDIMALVVGLRQVTDESYLTHRINQVKAFGDAMLAYGIPIITPVGGHAVYVDMNRFAPGLKPGDFSGISFTAILLAAYGHRACELGNFSFGSYDPKTQKEKFPRMNLVRFAVPRLRYEKQDLEAAAEAVSEIFKARDDLPAVDVVYGKELPLRHFKARFKFRELVKP